MITARRGEDRGAAALVSVIAAVALFASVGLVVDYSGSLRARQRADASAEEAARAAGQQMLGSVTVRGDAPAPDPGRAITAAQQYLADAGVAGSVTLLSDRIRVTTSIPYTPKMLGAFGVGPETVTGEADVRLIRGLEGPLP